MVKLRKTKVSKELEREAPARARPARARRGGLGIPRSHTYRYDVAHRKAVAMSKGWIDGHATRVRERLVSCGKGCGGCPHGIYFYEVWRGDDGKMHERYLGRVSGL